MKFPKLGKRLDLPFVLQMERRKEKEAVFFFGDVSDKIIRLILDFESNLNFQSSK